MIASIFCESGKGKLYKAAQLVTGEIDGEPFQMLAHPDGLVVRHPTAGTILYRWTEIVKATVEIPKVDNEGWQRMVRTQIIDDADKQAAIDADEVWGNNLYTVHVRHQRSGVHLSIHRHDRAPARDWRHFQRIKNEIVGPEFEAVELYPAEARLVDQANQYHLWVLTDDMGSPVEAPVGFRDGRIVKTPEELEAEMPGSKARQRPFEETP